MDLSRAWSSCFRAWPQGLPKAGIIVTAMDTIPFADFLIADEFVIVERDKPDSQGARKLVVALAAITAVKLTTTDELATLAGFIEKSGSPATQAPAETAAAPGIERSPSRFAAADNALSALERATRSR